MAGEVLDSPLVNAYVVGVPYDEPTKPAATGATAGTPGMFNPLGCEVPETVAEMGAVTATPATAWTEGQYVVAAEGTQAYWDGTAWRAGTAPAAPPGGELAAFDPADHTVEEVKSYVEAHPDERETVLEAEQAGKARVTLLEWLEGIPE